MLSFNVWTKSPNSISIYDDQFTDDLDSFSLLFVRRLTCEQVTVPVSEVKVCKGQVRFCFSLDCEVLPGTHDLTMTNTTKDEVVFSDCPAKVFDIPLDCVKNPL